MGTLESLKEAVTTARAEYAKVAAISLKNNEAILRRHRELVRAAVLAYYYRLNRTTARSRKVTITEMSAQLLKQSEEYSALNVQLQELRARNNALVSDLAKETQRANDFSSEAGIQAQQAKERSEGLEEIRSKLDELNPPADKRGTLAKLDWLIEENATLRAVNQAKAEAKPVTPETAAAIVNLADMEEQLNSLMLPNDKSDIAVLRAAVRALPADWINEHAADILRAVALPRDKRVSKGVKPTWCQLMMKLNGVKFGLTPIEAARQATPEHKRQAEVVAVSFAEPKKAS